MSNLLNGDIEKQFNDLYGELDYLYQEGVKLDSDDIWRLRDLIKLLNEWIED